MRERAKLLLDRIESFKVLLDLFFDRKLEVHPVLARVCLRLGVGLVILPHMRQEATLLPST